MKRYLVFAALLVTATLAIATPREATKQTAFRIDFAQIKKATQATHWEVLADHKQAQLRIGKSNASGHRIVAVCRVPIGGGGKLTTAIEEEIDRQMQEIGAMQKGEWGANRAMHTNQFGRDESIHVTAPKLHFAIKDQFVVIDLSITVHNGHATIVIDCTQ